MDAQIDAVRHFNRFYTKQIGVLSEGLLESPFSLTEARVIYEVAQRGSATATEVANELRLDPGYLSRIVRTLCRLRTNRPAVTSSTKQMEIWATTRKPLTRWPCLPCEPYRD